MINFLKTTQNCGIGEFCTDIGVKKTFRYIGYLLFFLEIIIPLIIIIMATVDLFKALTSQNPDESFKKTFITILLRIISGILIFFVSSILSLVVNSIDNFKKISDCASCLFKPFSDCDTSNVVKCEKNVKSIKINECKDNSIELYQGTSKHFSVSYNPSDATNIGIIFKSSDESRATINSNGYIMIKKAGNVKITATLKDDDSINASCNLKILERLPSNSGGDESSSTGQTKSNVGNYTYYNQCDASYRGTQAFCGSDPCTYACGAFSLTMVIANLKDDSVTPNNVMNFVCNNGHHGGPMDTSFFDNSNKNSQLLQKNYGILEEDVNGPTGRPSSSTFNNMKKRLKNGEMLICLVPFHFIVLVGDTNGNVTVLDPGNQYNNKTYQSVESAYNSVYDYWYNQNGNQWSGNVWAYKRK